MVGDGEPSGVLHFGDQAVRRGQSLGHDPHDAGGEGRGFPDQEVETFLIHFDEQAGRWTENGVR